MMDKPRSRTDAVSNPFSTRFIRPGALSYCFSEQESLETLLVRLEANGWQGEIVGPHGSGKSTLLAALIPRLTASGAHVTLYRLRRGMRGLPPAENAAVEWFPPADAPTGFKRRKIWIVDGAEQLSAFGWCRLRVLVWWQRLGLIVTSHRSLGLRPLACTSTSPEMAWKIVQALLPLNQELIERCEVEAALKQCDGNMRESLLLLFDVFQRKANDFSSRSIPFTPARSAPRQ